MISKQHRFHGYGSLRPVYARGQQVRTPILALKYLRNPRRHTFRAAVVVSRKVDKSAVARNRIRRRLYEIIRAHQGSIIEPYDLVFSVFSAQLGELSPAKLDKLVYTLLTKAGVIQSPSHHAIVEAKEN